MASVVDFQTRFPEFSDEDNVRLQMLLDETSLIMGTESRWLGYFDIAHMYYTAHLLTIALMTEAGDTGSLAPVKHQEVDGVVIKSAIADASIIIEDLYSTSYGKRYISYRRKVFTGIYGV